MNDAFSHWTMIWRVSHGLISITFESIRLHGERCRSVGKHAQALDAVVDETLRHRADVSLGNIRDRR